jgi:mono/diheme cytochrome c family protein
VRPVSRSEAAKTEIPEHLLKRSRERRAAIGQGSDSGQSDAAASADDAAATTTPATTTAAAAAPASTAPARRQGAAAEPSTPPPKPDPPYVAAAKQRRKIPFWAMATLGLMPVWGFMYVRALTEAPAEAAGPIGEGTEVYTNCSSCHGGAGGGGVGYAFAGGAVLETFPHIEDQVRWVYYGTEGYNLAGVENYGNPDREGGPHLTGELGVMPKFGESVGGGLTDEEIVAVVCHERYTLGGADPTSEEWEAEYEAWCSEEAPVFAAIESGEFELTAAEPPEIMNAEGEPIEIMPIGPEPVAGSPG